MWPTRYGPLVHNDGLQFGALLPEWLRPRRARGSHRGSFGIQALSYADGRFSPLQWM